jgi:hypothetical protein
MKNKLIEIKLLPTLWVCDWWLYDDEKTLYKQFEKQYGGTVEYYSRAIYQDACQVIGSTEKSLSKGNKVIVVNIKDKSDLCIIHEANHVIYELFKNIGIDDYFENQEWHSYYLEYIYDAVKKDMK